MNQHQIVQALESSQLSDDALLSILRVVARKGGFAVVCMTRADAESRWRDAIAERLDPENEETPTEPPTMPDDVWDRVQGTWAWRKGFEGEGIMDSAWWLVDDAVGDALRSS